MAWQTEVETLLAFVEFDLNHWLVKEELFEIPVKSWFWTGHETMINEKLVVFLFEEKSTNEGLGFETVGWYVAIIDNPNDNPEFWKINYIKGPETFGIIVGSSSVLKDSNFFGIQDCRSVTGFVVGTGYFL